MTVFEIALIVAALALFVAALQLGTLVRFGRKQALQQSNDALQTINEEERVQLDKLRLEKEGILKEALRAEQTLKSLETLKQDHKNLDAMRRELDTFEREESQRIDALELKRAETARRLADIQSTLDRYPPEILGAESSWAEFLGKRKSEFDELQEKTRRAHQEYEDAHARRSLTTDEAARLESRRTRLSEEIEAASETLERIKQEQVDSLKPYNERLLDEANELRTQAQAASEKLESTNEALALASQKLEALKSAIEAVGGATFQFPDESLNVTVKEMPTAGSASGDKLSMFRTMPECLQGFETPRPEESEEEMLRSFEDALEQQGLNYPREIVRAFHTALKVNDLSPLTVLSGLSGTGKSQLPRAYARFFGIHFLHVPVEPGWDSPQDLLGFYDFVAERYRPTDRARALGHFDSEFARDLGITKDRDWDKRMLIILLDEMNLARTEYYFSEFLSRLEMRGGRSSETSPDSDGRGESQIAIDLPYAEGEKPKHLYVPHNVLWVGTLNEDETTQALSDKVLDRANSIRFAPPQPSTLREHSIAPKHGVSTASGYLPYQRWLSWSDPRIATEAGDREVDQTLETLASLMQQAGRGFGYRITQSIKAYISRYPGPEWRSPMIDQINMRLLPKLAGAEMSDCYTAIKGLHDLAETQLGDPSFADALDGAAKSSEVSQIFNWPGYTYEETGS